MFLNVHEPIIDRATWEKVQNMRGTRKKRPKEQAKRSIFSGLLKCADCGSNLNYHFNQGNRDIRYFNCSNNNNSRGCTATHYIREDFLEKVVIEEIRRLTRFASRYEDDFLKAILGHSMKAAESDRARKQRELDGLLARDRELDVLFERLYEDNVSGKLTDECFAKMSKRYEQEQGELAARVKTLRKDLKNECGELITADTFLETVRRYTDANELSQRMLTELIDHIEVYICAGNRKATANCSAHRIRADAVKELVLDTLRTVSAYVRNNEDDFIRQIHEMFSSRQAGTVKAVCKKLTAAGKRRDELDKLIQRVYEDMVAGRITDKRFEVLSAEYEREQTELEQSIAELQAEVNSFEDSAERASGFIDLTRRYQDFTELTTPMLHEFVQKIVVHERAEKNKRYTTQKVEIHLNCVHDKGDGNPHAHIMLTMRPIEPDGSWGAKCHKINGQKVNSTDWNDRSKAEEWRAAWADCCNAKLRTGGFDVTVDHRSYERQGIEQIPTVHLGVAASRMEKRGIRTELGDRNREIAVTNQELRRLRARINRLQKWIAEEAANTTPPTLYDVIKNILDRRGIYNLQTAAKILIFLQENEIPDVAGLEKKVKSMRGDVNRIREDLKKVERRIDTLENHLGHSENLKKYRKIAEKRDALYTEYKALSEQGLFSKGKAKKALEAAEAFEWKHLDDLQDYDNAEKYLRDVLQGRFDPKKLPTAKWQEELAAKTAEKDSLYQEYNSLKSETQKVEQIRRSVSDIMRAESREQQPRRAHGAEL